jgi:hypothetical protein
MLLKLAQSLQRRRYTGMDRKYEQTKEFEMTTAPRTQLTAIFAAVVCAFMTIGFSVAPAVAPIAPYLA